MLKRFLLLLIAAVLLILTVPAFAQETTWTVSLYDQASGTVTRLSPTGETVDQFTLPMPEGFDSYSYGIATSPMGDKIAYVVEQVGDGAVTTPPSRVVVYDPNADTIVSSVDLAEGTNQEGFNAASDSLTFSADGSQVLVAYYTPVDENTYTNEAFTLDVTSGQVAQTLSADAQTAAGLQADAPYRASVLDFPGETAALVLQPVFVGMDDLRPAAENWNLGTGELAPIAPDLINAVDYLPATGEALILTYGADPDATLDPNAPMTMERIYNAVELFNGGAEIIYTADTVNGARFVQNGERVLVFSNFSEATLIERDGTVLDTFTVPGGAFSISSTPDGFVFYDPQIAGGLTVITTADNSFTETPISTEGVTFSSVTVQDYQMPAQAEEASG